jgi:hypothetical protein
VNPQPSHQRGGRPGAERSPNEETRPRSFVKPGEPTPYVRALEDEVARRAREGCPAEPDPFLPPDGRRSRNKRRKEEET